MPYQIASESGLTEAQKNVARWWPLGKTRDEIATIEGKTPRTVKAHTENALHKLNACNHTHAVSLLWEKGLIQKIACACLFLQAFAIATDLEQIRPAARPSGNRVARSRTSQKNRQDILIDQMLEAWS